MLLPDVIVVENVPEIGSFDDGQVIHDIITRLHDLGYADPSVLVLNSAWYGVPQKRLRAFIVANRHGLPNCYPSPLLGEGEYKTVRQAIADLADLPRDLDWSHDWPIHGHEMVERLRHLQPGDRAYDYNEAWRRLLADAPAPTVMSVNAGSAVHPSLPRALSVRELARLQSFPDSFVFRGGVSAERKQVANAVPPEMARHIGLAVRSMLDEIHGQ